MPTRFLPALIVLASLGSGAGACAAQPDAELPVLRSAGHNERGELFLADTDEGLRLLEAVDDAAVAIAVYSETDPPCRLEGPGVGQLEELTACTDPDFELAVAFAMGEVEIDDEFRFARPTIGGFYSFLGYEDPVPEVVDPCVEDCNDRAVDCIGEGIDHERCSSEQEVCLSKCS